jgi:hypothetical protein
MSGFFNLLTSAHQRVGGRGKKFLRNLQLAPSVQIGNEVFDVINGLGQQFRLENRFGGMERD